MGTGPSGNAWKAARRYYRCGTQAYSIKTKFRPTTARLWFRRVLNAYTSQQSPPPRAAALTVLHPAIHGTDDTILPYTGTLPACR